MQFARPRSVFLSTRSVFPFRAAIVSAGVLRYGYLFLLSQVASVGNLPSPPAGRQGGSTPGAATHPEWRSGRDVA